MRKFLIVCGLTAASTAHATVQVQSVSLSPSGNGWQVRVRASEKTPYTLRHYPSPDRLIIDVPDALLVGNPQVKAVPPGSSPTLRYSQFSRNPNVVRVVVDLPEGMGQWREQSAVPAQNIAVAFPAAGSAPRTVTAPTVKKPAAKPERKATAKAAPKAAPPAPALPNVISARDLDRQQKQSARKPRRQPKEKAAAKAPPSVSRSSVASRGKAAENLAPALAFPGPLPPVLMEEPQAPAWSGPEAVALIQGASCPEPLRRRLVDVLSDPTIQTSRYVWGAETPGTFDCSGLTTYIYDGLGVKLPRVSARQSEFGLPVDRASLLAGDLVFFAIRGDRVSHVGVYLGEGQFLHAASSRLNMKISSLDAPYYATRYTGARRVFQTATADNDTRRIGG